MHMHMCMCMQEEVDAAVFHATAADAGRVRPARTSPDGGLLLSDQYLGSGALMSSPNLLRTN